MRARRAAVAAFLLFGLPIPLPSAQARPFEFGDSGWEGTSELLNLARSTLGHERVRLGARLDWNQIGPSDGVLLLHPETEIDYQAASAFLRAGGRIAVLDDFGLGTSLLERFEIHRLNPPLRPALTLRDNPNLALAVPSIQVVAGQEQGRHPIVQEVDRLVTNHPTNLSHPNLTPVLTIPAEDEPNATLAVTGIILGRGRLFAMGDPSAVINLMLRYPGNRAFAVGLLRYLVEDDTWGQRGGSVFIVANRFSQRGTFGGGSGLARKVSDRLVSVRARVSEMHEEGIPKALAVLLAALSALVALVWVGSNATRPYYRAVPRYARATARVAQGGAVGRIAVLAAGTTHRALPLLELKSALEEGLALRLRADALAGVQTVLAEAQRQDALSGSSLRRVERLFSDLGRAEAAVATARPFRVTSVMVERMRREIEAILAEVDSRLGSPR